MNKISLSVIIPAKNEEANIGRCLSSLFKSIPGQLSSEIILVDCSSSDKTVEKARAFDIKIIGLKPNWFHSASAARYCGSQAAAGEMIFFIDADMTLEPGFLEKAIELLNSDPSISAVGGIGKEFYIKDSRIIGETPDIYRVKNKISKVQTLGGAGLYRASCLAKAGSFNPFLRTGGEERELAQRLRGFGFSLASIPVPMICHYTALVEGWDEFSRKKRSCMFISIGESMRLCRTPRFFIEALIYYKEFLLFLLILLFVICVGAYYLIRPQTFILYLLPAPFFLIYLALAFRKRSLARPALSMAKWMIIGIDIIRGITHTPKNPASYPNDLDLIKGDINVKK